MISLCRHQGTDKPIRLKTPSRSAIEKKSKNGDKIPDSAQLKGALWPGMDLFDSATPEMKRMRNQRKDVNVMRQMKARSAEIEPAEISYFADGEFRASRDIFGPLSDAESPVCVPVLPFLFLHSSHLGQLIFSLILTPYRLKIPLPRGSVGLVSQL